MENKPKRSMVSRNEGSVYVYRFSMFKEAYIAKDMRLFDISLKFMSTQTPVETTSKSKKKKKEFDIDYTLEVKDNEEFNKYIREKECDGFGFVYFDGKSVYQIFDTSVDDGNINLFHINKFHGKYAISRNLSIEKTMELLNKDILYLLEVY